MLRDSSLVLLSLMILLFFSQNRSTILSGAPGPPGTPGLKWSALILTQSVSVMLSRTLRPLQFSTPALGWAEVFLRILHFSPISTASLNSNLPKSSRRWRCSATLHFCMILYRNDSLALHFPMADPGAADENSLDISVKTTVRLAVGCSWRASVR